MPLLWCLNGSFGKGLMADGGRAGEPDTAASSQGARVSGGSTLDGAWVGTVAAMNPRAWLGELGDGGLEGRLLGGGKGCERKAAADEPERQDEGDPVGIVVAGSRSLAGEGAGAVMDDEMSPELLLHAIGSARAEDDTCAPLVSFELVVGTLALPALGIQLGQFLGRSRFGLEEAGGQPNELVRALDPKFDDPNLDWLGVVAGRAPLVLLAGLDLSDVG